MSAAQVQHERTDAYRQSVKEVLTAFGTDARQGLSAGEVRARLERYGTNELTTEKPVPAWRKFLAQFHDVLVLLLLIATGISAGLWFYERESALP
jgi:P-type Ca2+ transporter type 2C